MGRQGDLVTLLHRPAERWTVARYDAMLADPNAEIRRLCEAVDLEWDRDLGALPLSRHTVSAPSEDKWRSREPEIAPVLAHLARLADRAAETARR